MLRLRAEFLADLHKSAVERSKIGPSPRGAVRSRHCKMVGTFSKWLELNIRTVKNLGGATLGRHSEVLPLAEFL